MLIGSNRGIDRNFPNPLICLVQHEFQVPLAWLPCMTNLDLTKCLPFRGDLTVLRFVEFSRHVLDCLTRLSRVELVLNCADPLSGKH